MALALALSVDGDEWTDLATGTSGKITPRVRERLAAETVLAGQRLPVSSEPSSRWSYKGPQRTSHESLSTYRRPARTPQH